MACASLILLNILFTSILDSWLLKVVKNVKFAIFGDAPLYSYRLVKITIIVVCLYLMSLHHKVGMYAQFLL
jgi:hypothetical protein